MALAQEDIEQIRRLIREEVEAHIPAGMVRYDLELRERMVRVEEEFKHQREPMEQRFECLAERIDRFMKWSFITTLTVGGLVVAAIKYLP